MGLSTINERFFIDLNKKTENRLEIEDATVLLKS